MANAGGTPDLGPLPKSDANAELQLASINALHSLLQGQDAILFRDERKDDYGVDGAFEIKVGACVTNFRAQVQLKATTSASPNRDGSVSVSVQTANLNYLLNGSSPIYLLFDSGKGEFWYVWAHDEYRRLEKSNPIWRKQETVTLRLTERLTRSALPAVVVHVLSEGRMLRQIRDSLARATTSEPVTLRIDSASLETTDPTQARIILLASGAAIVASGYPKQVLRLLDIVDSVTKSLPHFQLIAGYAEYMLGNYYNAIGHIRQSMAQGEHAAARDQTFLARLKDACEFRVGIIDGEEYQRRTDERARAITGLESLEVQLEGLYYQCLRERNRQSRAPLMGQTRRITDQILNHTEATEPAKLGAMLTLLYLEGSDATLAEIHQKGLSWMRDAVPVRQTSAMLNDYKQAIDRLAEWEALSNAALKKAYELGHPILISEAHTLVLGFFVRRLMNQRLEARRADHTFEVSEQIKRKVLEGIESALAVDALNGTVEGKLRAYMLKADFLEIMGDVAGAKEIARQVYAESEAMSFATFAERAKELLEDRTLLMVTERELVRFKQTDEDVYIAGQSDDDLQRYARDFLESLGLPPDRLPVAVKCCEITREAAREHFRWCRYLEILEEQQRKFDPATAYRVLPNHRCVCEKFDYKTEIATPDATALMEAFKQMYCATCKDRSPKQTT